MRLRSSFRVLPVLLASACAGSGMPPVEAASGSPATAEAAPRPRRSRRVRTVQATLPAGPAEAASSAHGTVRTVPVAATSAVTPVSFGTPVVRQASNGLEPRWVYTGHRPHLVCEGATPSQVAGPQCPPEPPVAAVTQAFRSTEAAVLACRPPADGTGHLGVRAIFGGNGSPQAMYFMGVTLTEEQGRCLGQALCGVRLPTFRAPSASVGFEFTVLQAY